MSFSRSTVTRIAFPSPATVTPGPGAYDVRQPRAFTAQATAEEIHHPLTHSIAAPVHTSSTPYHSPPPTSSRARRMSSPCSGAEQSVVSADNQPSTSDSPLRTAHPRDTTAPLLSTPVSAAACSSFSPSHSPDAAAGAELTSSAQKRRLARLAQRGVALQPLAPIVTTPEVLRDKACEQPHPACQPQRVSPTATTAPMDDSAGDRQTRTAATATPLQGQSGSVAPSSCRRFRFAAANEGSAFASPSQQPHPIAALSHTTAPSAVGAEVVDARVQRLEERCRELEEARRRSHAAWMEELSSQALLKQQLTQQRQSIEQLERQTAALTQQRDTHATRVQQLQAEMSASVQQQVDAGGRLTVLQEQHSWLDEVSEQQSAAIAALKADVAAKEQQLTALQACLEAERRRYEELRSGVSGSLASAAQLQTALTATQAELQAVSQDKEQLIAHMDALERQVDEAAAREQGRAAREREANHRAETERKRLTAGWEETDSERQQAQAEVVHWQHKYQNLADTHTALQHQLALTARQSAATAPSTAQPGELKEERVSRLATVRRQLTEMRDSISQRLAAIRPVKRKDDKLLALQAELERSEAEMERLLKEHEATWQQVNRARRERCLSCGSFHNNGGHIINQREATQQPSDSTQAPQPAVDSRDDMLSDMSAFNRRLQADNAALRSKVEALTVERNEAVRRAARGHGAASSHDKARSRRDKRLRDDKENEAVLQPVDTNASSGEHKHRRSYTGENAGAKKRQSVEATTKS